MEEKFIDEAVEVVEEAIKKAPKKDVGFFLKAISIAIIIVAIGYAISIIFEGDRSVTVQTKNGSSISISNEDSNE
jgi:hypothetical protein